MGAPPISLLGDELLEALARAAAARGGRGPTAVAMTPGRPRGRTRTGEGGAAPGGRADRIGTGRWKLVRAGNDAVPPSVRRFMQRARRRRMRAALPWAVGAGVVALAGVLAWVLLGTGVFAVTQVRVTGTDLVTPARVREAAAVPGRHAAGPGRPRRGRGAGRDTARGGAGRGRPGLAGHPGGTGDRAHAAGGGSR